VSNKLALSEVMTLGQALAESKYFSDAKEASQAVVKVLAGQELGIGPIAAMSGIHIIQGKTEVGANILASLVKSPNSRYNYIIREHTNEVCVIEFFENDESVGVSEFSMDDAKKAGLANKDTYKQTPRNMLFARAMSNGVKWFCPDVTNGQAVYIPGEIENKEIEIIEPVPNLVIENEPVFEQLAETTQPEDNLAKQKWIESIMKDESFPIDSAPAEQVKFINKNLAERDLSFTVTVPEVLAIRATRG